MSNIPSVIKNLKLRITQLENYNSGLATESCEQQAKIAELEKEKERLTQYYDMWKGKWHELNNRMPIHNIEQQAKGVKGYIDRRKLAGGSYCSTTLMYIDELHKQAKALEEQ